MHVVYLIILLPTLVQVRIMRPTFERDSTFHLEKLKPNKLPPARYETKFDFFLHRIPFANKKKKLLESEILSTEHQVYNANY